MKRRLFFMALLFLVSLFSMSQNRHFLFIQTDDNQLFYVKANNQIFSSTSLGSVIVPNLEEGELIINIGFPQNRWNSLKYKVSVKGRDLAFVLKKSNSIVWSLFDYYSMGLMEPLDTARAANNLIKPANDFAALLSQVSGVNMDFNSFTESNGESAAKVLAVSESAQVPFSKKQTDISAEKKSVSQVDNSLFVIQTESKKEDTSNLLHQPSVKDSITALSKKKDNFVAVDVSNTKIDSSSLTKINSDSLFYESVPLKVKVDSPANKITLQIDASVKDFNKEKQIDTTINPFLNAKRRDKVVSTDTSTLMSAIINNAKSDTSAQKSTSVINDLKIKENLANKGIGLAPDSIAVMIEFKFEDSLSQIEKSRLKGGTLSRYKDSVIVKDSFNPESNHVDVDIKTDTSKLNSVQDSLMNHNKTKQNELIYDSVNSMNNKKEKLELDTVRTKLKCMVVASDKDFIQLRRLMANEDDESKMITTALMMFKEKCFTTLQIKNLLVLFLSDDLKYLFLETAYQFVSDSAHFENLQSLLTEEKNIERFKVLINQTKSKE